MARPWTLPAGSGALLAINSRSLPSTAHISAARSAGFSNPVYLCALVTAERTTVMARARRGHRNEACSNIPTKLRTAWSQFRLVNCLRRLQLAAPIREAAEHPVPRNTASWFYVFGSAALTVFLLQLVTGILLALIYVPS